MRRLLGRDVLRCRDVFVFKRLQAPSLTHYTAAGLFFVSLLAPADVEAQIEEWCDIVFGQ